MCDWNPESGHAGRMKRHAVSSNREWTFLREQPKIDLWLCDETGFEGNPKPRRIICRRSDRPRINYFGSHTRTSVISAAQPQDGKFASVIMPFVNSDVFQCFIYELEKGIDKNHRNIVALDNATVAQDEEIKLGDLEPLYLPSYSPDLNPIEEL